MSGSSESFGSLGMHVGSDWSVICHTYPGTTPILSIDAGGCGVALSIAGRTAIPATAVEFARQLARQAGAFAAECERLNAAGSAADGHAAA